MKDVARSLAVVVAAFGCALPALSQTHDVNAACCVFMDPANGNSNQTIIAQGVTVRWIVIDGTPHTVTNGTMPSDPAIGTLFNGTLSGVTPTFQHTFNTIGTFPYICNTVHFLFGMVGTVHVLPPASASSTGTGCQSSIGQPVTLTTAGLPIVGNSTFGFTVGGGPPGAQAFLFLAASTGPPVAVSPFCFVNLDLVSLFAFMNAGITPTGPQVLNVGGNTTFLFPVPLVPALGGLSGAVQALVIDGAAPSGFAISNAVTVVVGA